MKIILKQVFSFMQQGIRDYQEDARFPDDDKPQLEQRFFVVCDGVGGSEHGEVASNTVAKTFGEAMKKVDLKKDFTNDDFKIVLDRAYQKLDKVGKKVEGDMATTLTFVCFHEKGVTMAHMGDSVIYQVRPGFGIIYRSEDHSLINSLVHSGIISPEAAEDNPKKNVITRYMEPAEEDQSRCNATVVRTKDVKEGDYFILCSDGVGAKIDDESLTSILLDKESDNQEKTRKIAMIASDSSDNNTAFIIQIDKVEYEQQQDAPETTETTENAESTIKIFNAKGSHQEVEPNQPTFRRSIFERIKDKLGL